MERVVELYDRLADSYGAWGLVLIAAATILFAVQLYYYMVIYARIHKFSNAKRGAASTKSASISVVVLTGDNSWYLEDMLPKLLEQEYECFEVVLVEIGTTEDFSHEVALLKERYLNLVSTKIDQTPRFPISNKMAYNVGMKAAKYENVIFTTTYAYPTSSKWLECMGKGFENGEVVLGYCGAEASKGFANGLMRCNRLMMSVRYLSSAVKGRPYRGIIHNMGLTRKIYFDNRGFNHLNMNVGEDDLFVQFIANGENTSVVMNPHATMREIAPATMKEWREKQRFDAFTRRYYPRWVKRFDGVELWSRALFYALIITLVVTMPLEIKIGAGIVWFIRVLAVRCEMWRIRRRLGEVKLGWTLLIYDIIEPLSEARLYLTTLLSPPAGVWR